MISRVTPKRVAFGLASLVALATSLFVSMPVYAQVAGATLQGTVTDPSGLPIPNADVSVRNAATGIIRTVRTGATGFYSVPNLAPSVYDVTVSAAGFAKLVQNSITLTVGAQQVLNFSVKVGQVTQTVEVTSEAPDVQLISSAISAEVNSTTVRELPLNGRSWTDLANLQPGVTGIETQAQFDAGHDRGSRGFGAQLSISGGRPQQNNYRLDGISLNDYANGGPGSVLGGNLGVDAIQEFSVLTSNYSAEYGKTSGGVVNAISRSGTNQFHGSAYEFLRNSALDARNTHDGPVIPPFKRNQFGASAGGPIVKDNTFVFGDYEGIRQSKGVTQIDIVPTAAARAGNFLGPGQTVDPAAAKYLGLFPVPPTALPGIGDLGQVSFAGQQVVNENFFTVRVDRKFSQKDSLWGSYLFDDTQFTLPDGFNDILNSSRTKRQVAILGEDHIFSPALLNSVRFGFNRANVPNYVALAALNPLAADPTLGTSPGFDAAGVTIGGGFSPIFQGGLNTSGHITYTWNSFQGYDDASFTHGAHSLKFGFAVERMQLNAISTGGGGSFTFPTLNAFLLNQPSRFSAQLLQATSGRAYRQTLFGGYVQDDWRFRSNLTLNLGLRYEMTTVPSEVEGKLASLINPTDATAHLGSPFFANPTLRNFEPRVGFAWDPFHNGKTSVRAGFGMFDVLPLIYQFFNVELSSAPFYLTGNVNKPGNGSFPAGGFAKLGATSLRSAYIQQRPPRNYVMQWNLNVQRELARNLTATIGYVGSRGVHQLFRAGTINTVQPTLTSAGYLFPAPIASGKLINTNFNQIGGLFWGGESFYHAMELGLQKKMSHGLQLQGSFTWGKSIDLGSASLVGDTLANGISSPAWYDLNSIRGLSDFSIGRTFVINGLWQVPQFKSLSGVASRLANGWELSSIFRANDGVPFTPTFGTNAADPQGMKGTDPWAFPDRLTGPGCATAVNPGNPNNYINTSCFSLPTAPDRTFWQSNCDTTTPTIFGVVDPKTKQVSLTTEPYPYCFNLRGNAGRNSLIGPGLVNMDFSVYKNNYIPRIAESFNAQFRVEVFNILNRPNYSVPPGPANTDIFTLIGLPNSSAGVLSSTTTTTAREIQFALKLVW
jgi:hypothetical protein